ncbi:gas vesicle protein [Frankia sp. CNm7]|uniref:Gas vesicle protein n=1 Tax=Frankia nepalensis TaxID=1836974 RepID=A0A937RFS9_9ACTN|nr:gas vesicle protein [Frankia nepalensis]MBL7496596.1 gas vesicle protein [Frankia nepalensis]MBL7513339.1 gas vesicle protein [Frankia nepalensis]MBL7521598.1 gas vesicle protein [Frankia nepalensis]MBL7626604.1 gas vesicle protein [Frankia nepalensis]
MSDPARRAEPRRDPRAAHGAGRGPGPARRRGLGTGRALSDLLDRVVDQGVVVSGDVIIGLAEVDLIRLDLRLLLVGAQSAIEAGAGAELRPYLTSGDERAGDALDGAGDVIEGDVVRGDLAGDARSDTAAGGERHADEGARRHRAGARAEP